MAAASPSAAAIKDNQEQFRSAAENARQALERKPDHGLASMILGLCLARLGQQEEALRYLRQAVQCRPDAVEPALYLGQTLAEQGRVKEAWICLEQAQRLASADDSRPRL